MPKKNKLLSENRVWLAVQKETGKRVKILRDKRGDRSYDDTVQFLLKHFVNAQKVLRKTVSA